MRIKSFKLNLCYGALVFIDVIFFQSWVKIDFSILFWVLLYEDKKRKLGLKSGWRRRRALKGCLSHLEKGKCNFLHVWKLKEAEKRKQHCFMCREFLEAETKVEHANIIQMKVIKLMVFPFFSLVVQAPWENSFLHPWHLLCVCVCVFSPPFLWGWLLTIYLTS